VARATRRTGSPEHAHLQPWNRNAFCVPAHAQRSFFGRFGPVLTRNHAIRLSSLVLIAPAGTRSGEAAARPVERRPDMPIRRNRFPRMRRSDGRMRFVPNASRGFQASLYEAPAGVPARPDIVRSFTGILALRPTRSFTIPVPYRPGEAGAHGRRSLGRAPVTGHCRNLYAFHPGPIAARLGSTPRRADDPRSQHVVRCAGSYVAAAGRRTAKRAGSRQPSRGRTSLGGRSRSAGLAAGV